MRDINDIARMQYVLDHYDSMEPAGKSTAYTTVKKSGKTGLADTVRYIKAVNGTYYIVEAVPDTKAKTAYIVSAYMSGNANEAGAQHPVLTTSGPTLTSENANAAAPASSGPIIRQPRQDVNTPGVGPEGQGDNRLYLPGVDNRNMAGYDVDTSNNPTGGADNGRGTEASSRFQGIYGADVRGETGRAGEAYTGGMGPVLEENGGRAQEAADWAKGHLTEHAKTGAASLTAFLPMNIMIARSRLMESRIPRIFE